MELIDVLDENGIKTGEVLSRDEVHSKGLFHKIVIVAIVNQKKEILLQQRSKHKSSGPGRWDLSAAGHVLAGEEPNYAIVRELEEELSYKVNPNNMKSLISFKKDCHIFDFYVIEVCDIDINDLKLQRSEVQQVKFVTFNKLKEMIDDNLMMEMTDYYEVLSSYLGFNTYL